MEKGKWDGTTLKKKQKQNKTHTHTHTHTHTFINFCKRESSKIQECFFSLPKGFQNLHPCKESRVCIHARINFCSFVFISWLFGLRLTYRYPCWLAGWLALGSDAVPCMVACLVPESLETRFWTLAKLEPEPDLNHKQNQKD